MTFVVIELPRHLYLCDIGQSLGSLPLQAIWVQLSGKPCSRSHSMGVSLRTLVLVFTSGWKFLPNESDEIPL